MRGRNCDEMYEDVLWLDIYNLYIYIFARLAGSTQGRQECSLLPCNEKDDGTTLY